MDDATVSDSPRVAALRGALDRGDRGALGRFWRELAERGAPLVEALPGGVTLVTFLWRAEEVPGPVVLFCPIGDGNPARNRLSRLPGTDLWHRSYAMPPGTRMQYELGVAPSADALDRGWEVVAWRPDPLNPRQHAFPADDEGTFPGYVASVLELPAAPPQPWVQPRPGVPAGRVELQRIEDPARDRTRRIWLYAPPSGRPEGLVVLFDGWAYVNVIPTPTILDNLIADALIPPVAAVMVDNPDRARELGCDPDYTDVVADRIVPHTRASLGAPADPARTVVGGSSLGGVAAAFAALRRPDVFGNVLSQSGAFHWRPAGRDGRHEWLTDHLVRQPRVPLRFYLDVGVMEGKGPGEHSPTQVAANRRLRDALEAKGYPVRYAEFAGGHDYLCWRGTLADGLLALLAPERGRG